LRLPSSQTLFEKSLVRSNNLAGKRTKERMPQPMRIFAERPNVKKDQENNANHIADFSVINK